MIRKSARQILLLAFMGLGAGSMIVNCSSKKDAETESTIGSVGLAIKLSQDVTTDKVDYKITGPGLSTPITGAIAVAEPGATASVLVNGLPAGTGFKIELSAVSKDGKTTCAGAATFDVVAAKTTAVTVPLQCRGEKTTGSVAVDGKFNNCPSLTAYTASPLATAVGGVITVGATASDLDAMAALTFTWSATAGSFAKPADAATTYNCAVGGAQTLTVKVSDGQCEDTATIDVACAALACGNGKQDPGEECDPPNGSTCDSNCLTIPVCGNSKVEKGEQCDPPNGTTCSDKCQGIPILCGNGIVQPTEECDPPNGTTCDATCKSVAAAKCGDGKVNQPSEECDTGGDSATCTADCKKKASACEVCEASKCDATIAGCGGLTGDAKAKCEAALACIRAEKCDKDGDAQACFCGTASDIGCLGGQANGKCKAVIEAAAGSTDPGAVAERFVDPAFPLGRAANLNACDFESCKSECGK